jgi:hypothetical protein
MSSVYLSAQKLVPDRVCDVHSGLGTVRPLTAPVDGTGG